MGSNIYRKEKLKHRKFQVSENFNYISNERTKKEVTFFFSNASNMLKLKPNDLVNYWHNQRTVWTFLDILHGIGTYHPGLADMAVVKINRM